MSSKRKFQRQKKKKAEKEVKQALGLFERIPDTCLTCETEFDKTNKKMVSEWQVVVHKAEEAVRLYCPASIHDTPDVTYADNKKKKRKKTLDRLKKQAEDKKKKKEKKDDSQVNVTFH